MTLISIHEFIKEIEKFFFKRFYDFFLSRFNFFVYLLYLPTLTVWLMANNKKNKTFVSYKKEYINKSRFYTWDA